MVPFLIRQSTAKRSALGNALMEYTLIGALVLIVCVVALSAVGRDMNDQMTALHDDLKSKISGNKAHLQLQQLQQNAFQAAVGNTRQSLASNTSAAPSFMSVSAMGQTIQTVGANGATEILASALDGSVQRLKQQGDLTQQQLDVLSRLANEGHNMAMGEKVLHDAIQSGQSTVTFQGQTYDVTAFEQQFGFINNVGINASKTMDAKSAMPQLAPFMNLYQQAQSSGALSDPAVEAQVTFLSKQIAALSDLAKWNTTATPENLNSAYVTAMQQIGITNAPTSISSATHVDSTGICNSGGKPGSGCY